MNIDSKEPICPVCGHDFASPIIDTDGTIYIGGTDGALYAITKEGRLKWRALTPDEDAIRASAVIDKKSIVYFGAENGVYPEKDGRSFHRAFLTQSR
jgi:outer membrane protein assembly factor BamB